MVFSSPSGCIKVELTGVQQDCLTWAPRNAGRSSGSQLPERPAGVQAEEAPGEAGVWLLESRQRENVLIPSFHRSPRSLPSTVCWADCPLSVVWSCLLCRGLTGRRCVGLFPGSLLLNGSLCLLPHQRHMGLLPVAL